MSATRNPASAACTVLLYYAIANAAAPTLSSQQRQQHAGTGGRRPGRLLLALAVTLRAALVVGIAILAGGTLGRSVVGRPR